MDGGFDEVAAVFEHAGVGEAHAGEAGDVIEGNFGDRRDGAPDLVRGRAGDGGLVEDGAGFVAHESEEEALVTGDGGRGGLRARRGRERFGDQRTRRF